MRENWSIHLQKKTRILKFWVSVAEELYYPLSENKSADQLCSYCTADLRLCFRIGKIQFSHEAAQSVFVFTRGPHARLASILHIHKVTLQIYI